MAKKKTETTGDEALSFVLNDERVTNSYGFRVKNKSLVLDRFKENAVMLAMHMDSLWAVLGRWENIRIEGHLLLADAVFDEEDEEAKKVADKVRRGFIKACSLGFLFKRENMVRAADDSFDLDGAEVMEASIVSIPSNAKAVRLYAAPGVLMTDDEIRLSVDATLFDMQTNNKNDNNKMEKFKLNGVALMALSLFGLKSPESEAEVNAAIEAMHLAHTKVADSLEAVSIEKEALQAKLDAQSVAQATALVDAAVLDGKITADLKASFQKMAEGDFETTAKVLGGMPGKASLAGAVNNAGAGTSEVKTIEDFQKLPVAKQLAFKNEYPEGYAALFA